MGNHRAAMGVTSSRVRTGDMLFAAHLENLHDGARFSPSPDAREWHRLPRAEGNEYRQKPRCWMLLH